jgi:hypothetical protein
MSRGLLGCAGELHHLHRGTTHDPVRIGERLSHFEMIVPFGDNELHRFARRFHGRREIARLPLEVRRLQQSARQHQRCVDLIEVTLRAQRMLRLVGELE